MKIRRLFGLLLTLALALTLLPATARAVEVELRVTFNSNGSGGTNLDDNDMKPLIDAAIGSTDKSTITKIVVEGTASKITDWNWQYLLDLFSTNHGSYGDGWTSLTTLDLSKMTALTEIGDSTNEPRNTAPKLETLLPPSSLTTIGTDAFVGCAGLTSMTFPAGLTTIGDYAFDGCLSLGGLIFTGSSAPSVGTDAFAGIAPSGTLYYPAGADYTNVTSKLPSGGTWTEVQITATNDFITLKNAIETASDPSLVVAIIGNISLKIPLK